MDQAIHTQLHSGCKLQGTKFDARKNLPLPSLSHASMTTRNVSTRPVQSLRLLSKGTQPGAGEDPAHSYGIVVIPIVFDGTRSWKRHVKKQPAGI